MTEPLALRPEVPNRSGPTTETPALRQYRRAQREHPDCLVQFRLGDFFEIFGDDAVEASRLLGLTLTGRDFGASGRVPMCGVPHHSVQTYAAKLLAAGRRVAICDQVDTPRPGVKLVARKVVRVLTPGTLVEDSLLDPKLPRRCAGVFFEPGGVGVAVVDFSSGECNLGSLAGYRSLGELTDYLGAWDVVEVVLPASGSDPGAPPGVAVTRLPETSFSAEEGARIAKASLGPADEGGRGQLRAAALRALGGVAAHGFAGSLSVARGLTQVNWILPGRVMDLDASTARSLEVTEGNAQGGTSLVQLLDRTATGPGGRLLRRWLRAPLVDVEEIWLRQEAVGAMLADPITRSLLRAQLKRCHDLERLLARCAHRLAGPRDLQRLGGTLGMLPEVARTLDGTDSKLTRSLAQDLADAPVELAEEIAAALVEDPPVNARDGGFIKAGFDPELDRIVAGGAEAREFISSLEARERARTGIKGLKVGYNRVFGYYLEIRGAVTTALPDDYIRRQTLVGAERYVTEAMKEREAVVLAARERSLEREQQLLAQLLERTDRWSRQIGRCARAVAQLDCLANLADVGADWDWVMPEIDRSRRLVLTQGRHPLVEAALETGQFVPNDVSMDGESERIWLITGPNMAGKSTFLRQVAIICLLGQTGAPVPCSYATWGVVDQIFTRVGAQDDLAGGRSTFMVEMSEVAHILERATARSLLVFDEVGRGTSTYDGLSLAQALLEYLHDMPSVAARVLFSTHYHELTALDRMPALRNHRADVLEDPAIGSITFLHSIVPGGADRSYGIHVAQMAGVPAAVVARAKEILDGLEADRPLEVPSATGQQLALPLPGAHPLVEELQAIRVDTMTPLEALQKLAEWQRQAGR